MILKSRRRPIDLSLCLYLCCINIYQYQYISPGKAVTQQKTPSPYFANPRRYESDTDSDIENEQIVARVLYRLNKTSLGISSSDETEALYKTDGSVTDSVHWQIAKLLLLYGACGEGCLDLADGCPELKYLLTNPPSIDEMPVVIPWTSHSKTYKEKLAEVARLQNCKAVEGTTYWHHNEHIASGTFGHVFAGINEKDGMEVAIKRIEKLRIVRPKDKREIRTFTALTDCKQIVQYLAFFESKDFSYVILELMEGNLDDYIESADYDSAKNTVLSKEVVMGLKYLHDQDIIHRDLKPTNILYKTNPNLCLKIADFGLSRPDDLHFSVTVMSTSVGTRGWIAPEVVKSSTNGHSKSSDIFSCGLVLHYIFSPQQHPFNPAYCVRKSKEEILIERESNILKNKMEGWDNSLPPEISHLIQQMLEIDKKKRPSASHLLDHPLFWPPKKKMDLLSAVGNQPEFECPRSKRASFTALESDIEASFSAISKYPKWDDARYIDMPAIYAEMTTSVFRGRRSIPPRMYDTGSAVELVRFIRNAIAHVSDVSRSSSIKDQILFQSVFLKEFPNLVMEVYKAVLKHGWNTREEIQHVISS